MSLQVGFIDNQLGFFNNGAELNQQLATVLASPSTPVLVKYQYMTGVLTAAARQVQEETARVNQLTKEIGEAKVREAALVQKSDQLDKKTAELTQQLACAKETEKGHLEQIKKLNTVYQGLLQEVKEMHTRDKRKRLESLYNDWSEAWNTLYNLRFGRNASAGLAVFVLPLIATGVCGIWYNSKRAEVEKLIAHIDHFEELDKIDDLEKRDALIEQYIVQDKLADRYVEGLTPNMTVYNRNYASS